MNKKLIGILGIVLSFLITVYLETFINRIFVFLGLDINNYSLFLVTCINLIINIVICIIIYFIFKKDFTHSRNRENIFKMLLLLIISVVVTTIVLYLFNYVISYLCNIFKIDMVNKEFYNIFDKKIDFYLVAKIITDYLITPYIYTSLVLLSVDKLTRRNDVFILFSALLASILYGLTLNGTILFVIINSLSNLVLFIILAFLYKKNNSIWFVILLYGLYLISNVIIIHYLGF